MATPRATPVKASRSQWPAVWLSRCSTTLARERSTASVSPLANSFSSCCGAAMRVSTGATGRAPCLTRFKALLGAGTIALLFISAEFLKAEGYRARKSDIYYRRTTVTARQEELPAASYARMVNTLVPTRRGTVALQMVVPEATPKSPNELVHLTATTPT